MIAEVHDVLVKARALIADPERWCQGAYALDAEGKVTSPTASGAVRRCATGAMLAAFGSWPRAGADAIPGYRQLADAGHPPSPVSEFNDFHAHADVLTLFDRAIEATKP